MRARAFLTKVSMIIAPVVVSLAIATPPASYAAPPVIIVDTAGPVADGCGAYDGKTAVTDPTIAINGAVTGSTIVICPGLYPVSPGIIIDGKKLTIKRALTGPGNSPVVPFNSAAANSIDINNATVTFDGLILDGTPNTEPGFSVIDASISSLVIKNSVILGANQPGSSVVHVNANGASKTMSVTISGSTLLGYRNVGVYLRGPVKLALSSSHIDARDGDRVDTAVSTGVRFDGYSSVGQKPTGTVKGSRILNSYNGITITGASKVSATNNILSGNLYGIQIYSNDSHSADSIKLTGNTIMNVPLTGYGIYISNDDMDSHSIAKLSVSKNVIIAQEYGLTAAGITVQSDVPPTSTTAGSLTGSITGNTIIGIAFPIVIPNGPYPGLKMTGNDAQP